MGLGLNSAITGKQGLSPNKELYSFIPSLIVKCVMGQELRHRLKRGVSALGNVAHTDEDT
jgi:hypothetical protein